MGFSDKSIDEMYAELARVRREQDVKGASHQDYKLAEAMIHSILTAIEKKRQEISEIAEDADHHSCGENSEWAGTEKFCTVCGRKTGELE